MTTDEDGAGSDFAGEVLNTFQRFKPIPGQNDTLLPKRRGAPYKTGWWGKCGHGANETSLANANAQRLGFLRSQSVPAVNEVVLSCWIPMVQWGSFKAQQKLHFKAFFHAVH